MHKILLIDDERTLRLTFGELLGDLGYTVFTLANGAQAVSVYHQFKPDVVFVDLWMPEVDGFTTIYNLLHAAPELPIVAISGTGEQVALDHAQRLGARKALAKPLTVDEVVQIVEELCPCSKLASDLPSTFPFCEDTRHLDGVD